MALEKNLIEEIVESGRKSEASKFDDPVLGPLKMLPGFWKNTDELKGFGFNMMALPFVEAPNGYKVLMNQYNEELYFDVTDTGVPNRGNTPDPVTGNFDQTIVALDYFQTITQEDSSDFPPSGLHERFDGQRIHKEPGLWLHMTNHETAGVNIARLGTIPHGNSFLAPGRETEPGVTANGRFFGDSLHPDEDPNTVRFIPNINGVVIGQGEDPDIIDLDPSYFAPYKHFHENPYKGITQIPRFDGFDPVHTTSLLRIALEDKIQKIGAIKRVQRLTVDSTIDHAGINRVGQSGIINIPFVVREADATTMNSTFIMYEVEDAQTGANRYFMQYAQNVILDFISRPDGHPGRARWPHVSINTMERVSDKKPK